MIHNMNNMYLNMHLSYMYVNNYHHSPPAAAYESSIHRNFSQWAKLQGCEVPNTKEQERLPHRANTLSRLKTIEPLKTHGKTSNAKKKTSLKRHSVKSDEFI